MPSNQSLEEKNMPDKDSVDSPVDEAQHENNNDSVAPDFEAVDRSQDSPQENINSEKGEWRYKIIG